MADQPLPFPTWTPPSSSSSHLGRDRRAGFECPPSVVFDSFGDPAWSHDMAATTDDSVVYAGSTLQPGMPYQLRILAIKETIPVPPTFMQLSQTEDLAGVFTFQQ